MPYPSIYRAKGVKLTGNVLTAYVPQVFGDVSIEITDFFGAPAPVMGWVMFQGGNPEFPVWLGAEAGGGGGTVTDVVWVDPAAPTDTGLELWYDTDAVPIDYDARYVNVSGDTMTGLLNLHGSADMGGTKITALATPGNPTDAANKSYVDTKVGTVQTATLSRASGSADTTTGLNYTQTPAISVASATYPRLIRWSFNTLLTVSAVTDIYVSPSASGAARRVRQVTSGQSMTLSDAFILAAGAGLTFTLTLKGASAASTVVTAGAADLNYLTVLVDPA